VAANYTASINVAVQGQQALDRLNTSTNELSRRLDEIEKRRFGPNTSLKSFNRSLDETVRNLNRVTAGTTDETDAVTQYVRALGLANAARQRQNDLIQDQILREQGVTEELIEQAGALRDLARAENDASQARSARLAHYAKLRGAPDAYASVIGPVAQNRAGAANFREVADIAKELRDVEIGIARIRDESLRQSIQLENERLALVEQRRKKETAIRDAIFDAVTFGKSAEIKNAAQNVAQQVQTGTQNALIRGGLAAGTLALGKGAVAASTAAGDVAAGMTAHTGPLGAIQNVAGETVVNAVEKLGGAFNDALGGIPEIINHILQGIGDIPTAMGAAVVAAMAFGPAMKTAAEATYEAGKALGDTGLGKAVKETLDSQTNLFESAIDAASTMQAEIKDTTGLHLELGKTQIDAALENMTFQKKQNKLEEEYNTQLARSVDILRQRSRVALGASKPPGGFRTDGPLESPSFKATKKSIGKMGESLALGAGFPLLFGGGAGSVAGSVLGSFVGSGFGGQILGGALGQALDQAVAAAARLSNTLATVGDNFSKIREEGIYFTAELEKQVRLAKESGGTSQASNLLTTAVTAQTGDVGGLAGQGAAAAVNELQKAWNGVTKAVGTTLGILAGPFIFILNAALRGVQAIFFLFNGIATSIGNLINLIPGARQVGDALYEQSLKGTAEYENQLAELDKQIKTEYELVELAKVRTGYLQEMVGKSKEQRDIINKEADAAERLKKFEQEIKQLRAGAATGTSELREKALKIEEQKRLKFAENEKQILLKNAADLFNAIQDNNKRVADAQRAYDEQRIDMVRAATRTQADFDLQAARRLEDARMRMREQELDYINKIRQEELQTQRLLDRERQLQRSITGALSADPEQAEIINTVQTAVENYRTGRMAVEEEARAAQEQAQLQYAKAQTQIERYKYDNALRINRANEDSQIRVAKINDQIRRQNEEASKKELDRQVFALKARIEEQKAAARAEYYPAKAALEQEKLKPGTLTPADLQFYETVVKRASITFGEFDALSKQVDAAFKGIQNARLQPMAALPGLTDTSGAASAAETAANKQLLIYQQQIQKLQQINGLKNEDLQLAQALLAPGADSLKQFNDLIKQQKDRAAYEREYGELLREGIKPELAEQLAVINQMEEAQLRLLDNVIKTVEALDNDEFKDILDRLKEIRQGVTTKAEEARAGVTDVVPGQRLQNFISRSEDELKDLEALAVRVADGIGNAIANSMSQGIVGLIEGTKNAQQVFADFLKSVGDILIQEGTRMIGMYIAIGIAKIFAGLASGGNNQGVEPRTPAGNAAFMQRTAGLDLAGSAYTPNLAPTVTPGFATGGFVTGPTRAMVGEGGEPEYIIPASRMTGAMARYSAGARGSNVIPDSSASGGGMSSGGHNTYTLETVVINNVEYATVEQVREFSALAARQGAEGGYNRSMSTLRNSRSQRSRIGLR